MVKKSLWPRVQRYFPKGFGIQQPIKSKYIPFWQGDIVPKQYGYIWKVYKKVELNFRWSVQILVPWGGGASREGLGSMPEWQVGINSHK